MEEEEFELAIEGTSLKDLFEVGDKKTIVFDDNNTYGTSFSSIAELLNSKYVGSSLIIKNIIKEKDKFIFEALPFLLSPSGDSFKKHSKTFLGENLEFIQIKDIFYISNTVWKYPTCRNSILDLNLNDDDTLNLTKLFKDGNITDFKHNFTDKSNNIYRAILTLHFYYNKDFQVILDTFGPAYFLYPKYGSAEISESASFVNAMQGVAYILDKGLSVKHQNGKYQIQCDKGTAVANNIILQKIKLCKYFIRLVVIKKKFLTGNFLAYLVDKDNYAMDLVDTFMNEAIKIIGINNDALVCPENFQILYFIRKGSNIPLNILEKLQISSDDCVLDAFFQTLFDIEQFD